MNSFSRLGLFAACVSCSNFFALAVTVNDGTSANNLVKLSNANSGGNAVATIEVNTNGFLVAAQTNVSSDFPLSTVWYAGEVVPTGGVYTVAGDFRPATDSFASRGGVMGWLSLASSNGIALQVSPNDPVSAQTTFRVSTIDFSAGNGDDSDSFNHLFTTNGVAAAPVFGSALSAANPNYSLTNLATFQLAFSAPSAADIAALSNATAHLMAMVFQGSNAGAPVQVSQTVELLTDLPLPDSAVHRFGYFAVLGCYSIFCNSEAGDVIGALDNLNVEGEIGVPPPNMPPAVSITSPTNGASFTEGANISLIANATDSDGAVVRVDFFAATNLLGTATNSPFSLTWSNVAAGSYSLTAQAVDNRAGNSTSAPVSIVVRGSTGGGPTLTIQQSGNSVVISWPSQTAGYRLEAEDSLSNSWTDVITANNQYTESLTNHVARFYQLISGP